MVSNTHTDGFVHAQSRPGIVQYLNVTFTQIQSEYFVGDFVFQYCSVVSCKIASVLAIRRSFSPGAFEIKGLGIVPYGRQMRYSVIITFISK